MVPWQLPVLHDPDRLHRALARAVARLDDRRRRGRHLGRAPASWPSTRPQGPTPRPAADDPVPRPVRLPRRHRRALRDGVHLHRRSTSPTRCCSRRACTAPSAGTPTWSRSSSRCWRRAAGDLRLRLGAPRVPRGSCTSCCRWWPSSPSACSPARPATCQPTHLYGFNWVGFMAQFSAAAAYNITYAPYVSDYSRYLPQRHIARQDHRLRCSPAPRARRLADRARRLARHPARRDRRPGRHCRPPATTDLPPRRGHRLPLGVRACRHHGHERLRRDA